MSNAIDAGAIMSPWLHERIDKWLGSYYGGYLDKHTAPEIEMALAGALEKDHVFAEDVRRALQRYKLSPFDRSLAFQIALVAMELTQCRSYMGVR